MATEKQPVGPHGHGAPAPVENQDGLTEPPHPTRGMDSHERPDHHAAAEEREAPRNLPLK